MLTDFTVAVTHYTTTCRLHVDLMNKEASYVVTHKDIIVQMGSIDSLVPGTVVSDVSVPDRAIEFLRKRIEGMHFSCQLLAGIQARTSHPEIDAS